MNKWFARLFVLLRCLLPMKLLKSRVAEIANQVIGIIVALFILGAVGATAVIMAANASQYADSGVSEPVILIFTTAVPVLAGVGIMLAFLPKRS